ncbi:DNA glycosylase AlkZ-like family protein [Streptomyces hainanensis]|uniref:Uncharacterized protein n=1 Tax=Streptomyces hainanensis TaxID=402648 RepID=A0A4R4THJ8_9ACTN|nr:crosslink repair DNA glycosylase YcaQ family protein [Streptomyces hainanensis]TDC75826.1 hypothetical protein E1283_11310 [Streptomyces hainanensis]
MWNRLADFDAGELDAAFADRVVVRSNMVRMTLHAVHAGDYRAFREATEPSLRAAKLGGRFLEGGFTEATAFHALPEEAWVGLAAGARRLVAFLGSREPSVYRRYHHWWTRLPAGGARVLPA